MSAPAQGRSPVLIPAAPGAVELAIAQRWDGALLDPPAHAARVRLAATPQGLAVEAGMGHAATPRLPDTPPGARVAGLWHYDVVECFLLAGDGRYLELELGAGGHYLVLAFDAPRRLADDFAGRELAVAWRRDDAGWTVRCRVPRDWVPQPIAGVNAFAIADGGYWAHAPVGGVQPDFHRTAGYPRARIPSWE